MSIPPPDISPEPANGEGCNREILPNRPQVTEQQARSALLAQVAEHCCYGKDAAKEMAITKINYSSAFHVSINVIKIKGF